MKVSVGIVVMKAIMVPQDLQPAHSQCGQNSLSRPCQRIYKSRYSSIIPGHSVSARSILASSNHFQYATPSSSITSPNPTIHTTPAAPKVFYAGTNIAGFDFGCDTSGICPLGSITPPGQHGIDQMTHFVSSDNLNTFRLPVSWQYLVADTLGGPINSENFAAYDELVQGCIAAGAALCIIDIHNYARWNGGIVGQGGPSDNDFIGLWSQLAAVYNDTEQIAFGIMNEPHDLSLGTWAETLQAVVNAIRSAGANSNIILLPGSGYCAAGGFLDDSAAFLKGIQNPDGGTEGLVFDVHQYLDFDHSGRHAECVSDMIDAVFRPLAGWLRENGRMAFLSETGGGSDDPSCLRYVCSMVQFLNQNNDVYLGFTGWGAGSFSTGYVLSQTPYLTTGSGMTDQPLVKQCIIPDFR
ncbi:glycoside hydrolase family 5 protein [Glonium stellatum]|uniref:Endoglucanase EG-II n=1 Tax=Glonium stellatum TaxID=574774 RepID=A0A8E2ET07_9PEZI|nr:glycoside hydrolase family 5 protein [Glonium stellatum]